MLRNQQILNDNLMYAALIGDLPEVARQLADGADVRYSDISGRGVLSTAVMENHLHVVEYLLMQDLGGDPEIIGSALFYVESPEMVRLLASFHPDCTVTNDKGFIVFELMVFSKAYDLIEAYIDCGLSKPQCINPRVISHVNKSFNIRNWSILHDIEVPVEYYEQLEQAQREYPYSKTKREANMRKVYNRIIREVSRDAQDREAVA